MSQWKIRTTMRPTVEVTVGDAELLDLQRQGLLAGEPVAAEPATDIKRARAQKES